MQCPCSLFFWEIPLVMFHRQVVQVPLMLSTPAPLLFLQYPREYAPLRFLLFSIPRGHLALTLSRNFSLFINVQPHGFFFMPAYNLFFLRLVYIDRFVFSISNNPWVFNFFCQEEFFCPFISTFQDFPPVWFL